MARAAFKLQPGESFVGAGVSLSVFQSKGSMATAYDTPRAALRQTCGLQSGARGVEGQPS